MYIENPSAYDAAIQRRIRSNARIGRNRRWMAEDPTRAKLIEQMYTLRGEFAGKMIASYDEWGSLTGNQERAVRNMIERNAERTQAIAAQRAHEAETSQHVGAEGDKNRDFALTIKIVLEFETQFGTMLLHIMHDAAGNVIIYKGSKRLGNKGETIAVRAGVKKHDVREGVKQTIIWRPKVLATTEPCTA